MHSQFFWPHAVESARHLKKVLVLLSFLSLSCLSPFDPTCLWINRAGKKPRSDCSGQVNFTLGLVKIEVCWPGGQVKLASVVLRVWEKCQLDKCLINSSEFITRCTFCPLACRAATKVFHRCLSLASFWIVFQRWFKPGLISVAVVRRYVFLGLLRLHLPSGVQCGAVLVMESSEYMK